MTPEQTLEAIVRAADSKKARDITAIRVFEQTTLTDYFVVMTGTSTTHIRALSEEIELKLKREHEVVPHHIEGITSNWILMDYGDVVIHIFDEENRLFYDLERIWRDGKVVEKEEIM